MLIGFDASRAFASEATGTENYSLNLLRSLAKIDRKNRYRVYLREGSMGPVSSFLPISAQSSFTSQPSQSSKPEALRAVGSPSRTATPRIAFTIEFHPEEGKYHFDGCAACGFSCCPKESKKYALRCPSCKKSLTLGVEHRVEELADREGSLMRERKIPYKSIVPLAEIIAECLEVKSSLSKRVEEIYLHLTNKVANEFTLLLETPIEVIIPLIPEAIDRMRRGHLSISPGYDGIYGTVNIFSKEDRPKLPEQKKLF